ncbi:bifunctional rhamnulose-1-phosphate aldolase/short-chain dehydrogenase [SAR202 cluster bacterium AC-409-J13_OGT_754m]|nr:bifunctional rhamnulose-1-phosphate aldolase/short-chain dehydrogenase [SAR202 cluster bacterium AC-409-J13_OGT_754m]
MKNLWSRSKSSRTEEMDLLVYQSRLIGADSSLVVWGGGNTSIKTVRKDFRDRDTSVLLVKGSGSDLKTIDPKDFPSLRMEDVLALFDKTDMTDDDMVTYLGQCMLNPKDPRPSIETLLHAFLPYKSVIHSHADAIVSLTNTSEAKQILEDIYGSDVSIVEYIRPGFTLSKKVGLAVQNNPNVLGVVLMNHGLFTWGDDPKQAYDRHIDLVNKAENYARTKGKSKKVFTSNTNLKITPKDRKQIAAYISPTIRGLVSNNQSMVLRYDDSSDILEFVNSKEGQKLSQVGPATPDHTLQTKIKPLWVPISNSIDNQSLVKVLSDSVKRYVDEYIRWYQTNTDGNHKMLDPYPRVILVPGIGMWTTGKDYKSALIAGDIYHHTIKVLKTAESIGQYTSLSDKDAYDVEYWPMELYKLTLAPPQLELARKITMITGAANGIGKAIAERFAYEGSHLLIADVDYDGIHRLSEDLNRKYGNGRVTPVVMDVTKESDINAAFQILRTTYGGLDILVSNAGVAPVGAIDEIAISEWNRAFNVNATGHFLVSREAVRLMKQQELGGSLVFIGTRNIPAPGKDFGAYSASKAAEAQLARVLAIESAEHGIRCNIINPDAIFEGSNLWSVEVRRQRAKAHGVRIEELEQFYQKRNLLNVRITGADVAEATLFFASSRTSKTTGAMHPVDGGIRDAFPR